MQQPFKNLGILSLQYQNCYQLYTHVSTRNVVLANKAKPSQSKNGDHISHPIHNDKENIHTAEAKFQSHNIH